jgi:hypothetical protein
MKKTTKTMEIKFDRKKNPRRMKFIKNKKQLEK